MSAFNAPIPAYNNPPITPQYYAPRRYEISSIILGNSTTVTTSTDHNYVIGQQVRLLIPPPYGTIELNEQVGYVTSIPASDQVVLNINSFLYNSYIPSPTYSPNPPEILAVGDISNSVPNTGRTNNATSIQGSFINISPQ